MGSIGGTSADVGRVYGSMAPNDLRLLAGLGGGNRAYEDARIAMARKEAQRPLEEATRPLDYGYGALKERLQRRYTALTGHNLLLIHF